MTVAQVAGSDERSPRQCRTIRDPHAFHSRRVKASMKARNTQNGSYEIVPAGLIYYRRCPNFGFKIRAVPYREPMVPFRMKSHIILKYPSGCRVESRVPSGATSYS